MLIIETFRPEKIAQYFPTSHRAPGNPQNLLAAIMRWLTTRHSSVFYGKMAPVPSPGQKLSL